MKFVSKEAQNSTSLLPLKQYSAARPHFRDVIPRDFVQRASEVMAALEPYDFEVNML